MVERLSNMHMHKNLSSISSIKKKKTRVSSKPAWSTERDPPHRSLKTKKEALETAVGLSVLNPVIPVGINFDESVVSAAFLIN